MQKELFLVVSKIVKTTRWDFNVFKLSPYLNKARSKKKRGELCVPLTYGVALSTTVKRHLLGGQTNVKTYQLKKTIGVCEREKTTLHTCVTINFLNARYSVLDSFMF
jgi:hypothetical protein